MKIGIHMNAYPCPPEEKLALMKKHGFDSTFCFSNSKDLGLIMEQCKKLGIEMENFHAPFSHVQDMWLDTPEGDEMLAELIEAVDTCKKYGVDTLVVHVAAKGVPTSDIGLSRFDRLIAHARENGITLAFENLSFKLSKLAHMLEEYEEVAFCWDTGHEQAFAHGMQFMPLFGKKIAALHMHDNPCVHMEDRHMLPFDGKIDFDRVALQLAQSNYNKSIMLESMAHRTEAYMEMGADAFYQKAADAARKLADMVEKQKASL